MTNKKQEVAKQEQPKTFYDVVLSNIKDKQARGLVLPKDYALDNAINSAQLTIAQTKDRNGKFALEVCSRDSITQALTDMVIQGLSPAKKQCYFIVYGDKLQLLRSYFGSQVALKRLDKVDDVWANVIYEDDEFDYDNVRGQDHLLKHKSCLENRDKPIIGAYAIVLETSGKEVLTIMSKKEIQEAWNQSKDSNQKTHKRFPQEMAKRTAINRACKNYVNTSTDSDILVEAFNRTTENEYKQDSRIDEYGAIDVEINNSANQEVFEEKAPLPAPKPAPAPKPVEVVKVNEVTGEVVEEEDWAL